MIPNAKIHLERILIEAFAILDHLCGARQHYFGEATLPQLTDRVLKHARRPGPEIADLVLFVLLIGKPSRAKQLLGFMPMLQGAAFRATLFLPNRVRQRRNVLLLPGLHNH